MERLMRVLNRQDRPQKSAPPRWVWVFVILHSSFHAVHDAKLLCRAGVAIVDEAKGEFSEITHDIGALKHELTTWKSDP
jgi:hypothetical protein